MTVRIVKQIASYFSSEPVTVEAEDYPTELDAVEAYNWDGSLGDSQLVAIEELIQVLNYDAREASEDVEYRFEYV